MSTTMPTTAAPVYARKDMISVSQAATIIGCSRQHVYALIDLSLLTPVFRYGVVRGWRIPRPVVEAYKKSCQL